EDFVRMFAEQRRTIDLHTVVRQLNGLSDSDVFTARRMIDTCERAGDVQRLVFGNLLHREDRTAGDVDLVEDFHGLELALGHGPLLDLAENLVETRQTRRRLGVIGVILPFGLADHIAYRSPDL